jgi:hypothetical protein
MKKNFLIQKTFTIKKKIIIIIKKKPLEGNTEVHMKRSFFQQKCVYGCWAAGGAWSVADAGMLTPSHSTALSHKMRCLVSGDNDGDCSINDPGSASPGKKTSYIKI